MIAGIGVDLVDVARMAALLQRRGARASQHLLSELERSELANAPITPRLLAKRFAAKEALAKALGSGLRHPVQLQAISVVHDGAGKPAFAFSTLLQQHVTQRGIRHIHLSLSDEQSHAIAFVVAEV